MKKMLASLFWDCWRGVPDARKRIDEINVSLKEDNPVMEKCQADFEKRDNTRDIPEYVLYKPDIK